MEIYYVNSKGEKIYFDRLPYLMLTDTNVFNYEWSYDIKNNNLYNIRRSLPTKDVSIVITGKDYEDYKKNTSLERVVIDYIAGMTDRFLKSEYEKLN